MTRSVTDLAKVLDVIVGYDPDDPMTSFGVGQAPETFTDSLDGEGLKGARIGVMTQSMGFHSEPDCDDIRLVSPVFDRAPRAGVLGKPWATLEIGLVDLAKGSTKLILSADSMPGSQVMEVREVILERLIDCSSA